MHRPSHWPWLIKEIHESTDEPESCVDCTWNLGHDIAFAPTSKLVFQTRILILQLANEILQHLQILGKFYTIHMKIVAHHLDVVGTSGPECSLNIPRSTWRKSIILLTPSMGFWQWKSSSWLRHELMWNDQWDSEAAWTQGSPSVCLRAGQPSQQ